MLERERTTSIDSGNSSRRVRNFAAWAAALLVAALVALAPSPGRAQTLLANPSLPLSGIGRVEAIAVQADGKIIVGGAFTYVSAAGDKRINLARFNSNGSLDAAFDFRATSAVNALAIIGNTLYLGGDFTGLSKTGGASTLRNRLAAIDLPSLTITSWDPDVDGEVFALAASGTTLYAGGRFTFVGSTQRIGGAAFDTANSGVMTGWDPEARDANAPGPAFLGVIYAIAPFGGAIYVGGTFTQIGGLVSPQPRDNIGAVDPTTGAATAFDPIASNGGGTAIVRTIVPTASAIYLGGQFSGLNGFATPQVQRLGIGAVSTSTGVATAWNPGMTNGFGTVRALALDGTTMYAGGEFTAVGGATRNRIAGIDVSTPAITNLSRSGTTATATVGSTAGLSNGNFITIAGATPDAYNGVQGPVAVVDATHFTFQIAGSPASPATGTITYARNANATAFNPLVDDDVHALALTGSVLAGGLFLKANNVLNPAFGGFNKTSGATTIAGYVYDTAAVWQLVRQADGKTIVAGDFFMNTGGVFYRGLARLNANDTLDTSWNPVITGQVVTAALGPIVPPATAPDTVLIGGSFSAIGATTRQRLAAVNLTSGLATSFDANVNSVVNKVLVDGTTAYIGGQFTSVGGSSRNFVAAVNATSGALQSWYPAGGADDFVETIAVDASNVYVGGSFLNIGGQQRPNIAKIAKSNSAVDAWNPGADEKVFGITVVGSTVYVGGNFAVLGGQARNFAGAVNATTGVLTSWNPNPDFVVLKIVPSPTSASTLYLAGAFVNANGVGVGNAAAVNSTTGALVPWFPLLNDASYDIIPDATRVLLSGVFEDRALVPRLSLAALTIAGLSDPPTNPVATPGNASASVSFTPPGNNGGNAITGYTVTSSPAGGVDSNAGSTTTTHVITGLTNGVAYTFTVTATNSVGTSPPSTPSNSVTPAVGATAPGAPTSASATAGNTQATVTFVAPASNGGSAITGYTVTSNPAGGVDSNAGSTSLSHIVTGLTNGVAYTFTVKATNAIGTGPASAASNSVTPTTGPDTTPDAFAFGAAFNVAPGVSVESKAISVAGINAASPISVTGGSYRKNGGAATAAPGTVVAGDTIVAVGSAPGAKKQASTVTVTIGGVGGTFTINTEATTRSDLSGDGRSDLVWRNTTTGDVNAWMLNGAALIAGTGFIGNVPPATWTTLGVGDFDGDGKADILWQNTTTGSVNIWFMNGTALKAGSGAVAVLNPAQWQFVGIGDINGDGKSDILWRNIASGDVYVWMMNGLSLVAGSGKIGTAATGTWNVIGVGDVDGDGKADLVFHNATSGSVNVWLLDGTTLRAGSGAIAALNPAQWQAGGVGDTNGDGKADIVWRNVVTGDVYVWFLNGLTLLPGSGFVGNVPIATWTIVGVADFDGDGKHDILWRSSTHDVNVWLLNGTALKPGSANITNVGSAQWQSVRP